MLESHPYLPLEVKLKLNACGKNKSSKWEILEVLERILNILMRLQILMLGQPLPKFVRFYQIKVRNHKVTLLFFQAIACYNMLKVSQNPKRIHVMNEYSFFWREYSSFGLRENTIF